jgi:hypothetical protein
MQHAPCQEFGKEESIFPISGPKCHYLDGDMEHFSEPSRIVRTEFPGKVASTGMNDKELLKSNIYFFLVGGERLSAGNNPSHHALKMARGTRNVAGRTRLWGRRRYYSIAL